MQQKRFERLDKKELKLVDKSSERMMSKGVFGVILHGASTM